MKILILGGTGAMGKHLVKLLAEDSHDLTITTRKIRDGIKSNGIVYIEGNAKDNYFLFSLLKEKWDVIIDFMVYTTNAFKCRVDHLLNATGQYIYLSSARVYSSSDNKIFENSPRLLETSEDQKYLLTDEYALSKARQENILLQSSSKNWTIIRPYITYSEDRLQLGVLEKEDWLYRAIKGRTIVFSRAILNKLTTITYGLDVAIGIKHLIGNETACGEVFHITAPESVYWKDILNLYLNVIEIKTGFKPKIILQDTDDFLHWYGSSYQVKYDRLFNRQFDCSKIIILSNMQFTSYNEGLKACIEHFLLNPSFGRLNWKSEALRDKITGEFADLHEINGIKNKFKYILYRYIF